MSSECGWIVVWDIRGDAGRYAGLVVEGVLPQGLYAWAGRKLPDKRCEESDMWRACGHARIFATRQEAEMVAHELTKPRPAAIGVVRLAMTAQAVA